MRICAGFVICLVLYGLAAASAVGASDIVGVASVIDGDRIEIHDQRIRLFGIDAPEGRQNCYQPDGTPWRCGQKASLALADRVERFTVRCEPRDVDRYRCVVAVCSIGSEDLNRWMVANGWAAAYRRYTRDYVSDEARAREDELGIWSGSFTMPWDWRASRSQ